MLSLAFGLLGVELLDRIAEDDGGCRDPLVNGHQSVAYFFPFSPTTERGASGSSSMTAPVTGSVLRAADDDI